MPNIKGGMDVKVNVTGNSALTMPGVLRQANSAPTIFPPMNDMIVARLSKPSVHGMARTTKSHTWVGKWARDGPNWNVARLTR